MCIVFLWQITSFLCFNNLTNLKRTLESTLTKIISFAICEVCFSRQTFASLDKPVIYKNSLKFQISSVQFSCSIMSSSLWLHGLQHARPPCPSPTPKVYSKSCPLSWWCHPAISTSVVPFSSCPQSFPASGSFLFFFFFIYFFYL